MRSLNAGLTLAAVSAAAVVFSLSPTTAAPAGGAAPGGGSGGRAGVSGQVVKLTQIVPDGKPHKFEAKNKQFTMDGDPTLLIAGEMHFGRMLPEDFEARVKQAKAMGLNTLSFYLFWNLTEPREGEFDFTGMNDVRRMFKICQDNGMWVILRPGPYCCAEVEYGGIPWWTCKYPEVKIRTTDPKYMEWSKRYIDRVAREVADLQVTRGGPLLMVQAENEYAIVGAQPGANFDYMKALEPIFQADFEVPLLVCDPGSLSVAAPGRYPASFIRGRNGLKTAADYQAAAAIAGDYPVYAPEVYTAWFSGWGQPIATKNADLSAIVDWTNNLLNYNASWCYYVFFGGTNWGYNTGCNEWLPLMTTYDYSAPIDEAGRTTPKYRALREILAQRTGRTLPEPPPEPAVAALPAIKFTEHESLLQWFAAQPEPLGPVPLFPKPQAMESLGQDYGFILYRKTFPNGIKGALELRQARDYAVTMVNGKTVGKSFIGYGPASNTITLNESGPVTLDILVHNLGRISVITSANTQDRARKGLIGGAFLDGAELADWMIFSLPLPKFEGFKPTNTPHAGPTFYHATFTVDKPASTFLNLSNFSMGVVWVNGHNLGRFWDRGGARSLFLSEHFLKPGANDITVLELHDAPKTPEIAGTTRMIETPPVPFALVLDRANPTPAPTTAPGRRGGGGVPPTGN